MKFFLQALVIIHLISLLPSYAYSADANIVAGCRHAVNRADGKEIPSDSATFFQLGICNGFIRGLEEAFMFWREAEPDPVLLICIPEKSATDKRHAFLSNTSTSILNAYTWTR